jgi:hypothetical protein
MVTTNETIPTQIEGTSLSQTLEEEAGGTGRKTTGTRTTRGNTEDNKKQKVARQNGQCILSCEGFDAESKSAMKWCGVPQWENQPKYISGLTDPGLAGLGNWGKHP